MPASNMCNVATCSVHPGHDMGCKQSMLSEPALQIRSWLLSFLISRHRMYNRNSTNSEANVASVIASVSPLWQATLLKSPRQWQKL